MPSEPFDDRRDPLPKADAHGLQPVALAGPVELVQERGHELGARAAERVRAIDRAVPVFFVTGWGLREEDNPRLAALNIQRCLFKPIRPEELDAAIQSAFPSA